MEAKGVIKNKHFGSIYKTRSEQLSVVIPFLISGLENREKCIYVYTDNLPDEICDLLATSGIDINKTIREEQLVFLTKEETYLTRGFFSPDGMLDFIQYAHYDALKNGFSGISGFGEMSWALSGIPGSERLIEYENRLNQVLIGLRFNLLCQYNETKFPENTLLGVIHTHPDIMLYGKQYNNPYYVRPDVFSDNWNQEYPQGAYSRVRDHIASQNLS
ncbi:MAG: MEDS domain-containing protein [Candidatus Omnitrophota bacterium]